MNLIDIYFFDNYSLYIIEYFSLQICPQYNPNLASLYPLDLFPIVKCNVKRRCLESGSNLKCIIKLKNSLDGKEKRVVDGDWGQKQNAFLWPKRKGT